MTIETVRPTAPANVAATGPTTDPNGPQAKKPEAKQEVETPLATRSISAERPKADPLQAPRSGGALRRGSTNPAVQMRGSSKPAEPSPEEAFAVWWILENL